MKYQFSENKKPSSYDPGVLFVTLTGSDHAIDNLANICECISWAMLDDHAMFDGDKFDTVLSALQEVVYDLHTHDPENYAKQQEVVGQLLQTLNQLFKHSQGRLLVQQHSEQYRAILSELTDHFLLIYYPINFQADVKLFDMLYKLSVDRQLYFLKDTNVHNLSIFISCIAADLNTDQVMNALHLMQAGCGSRIDAGQDLSGVANALTELFKNRITAADSLSPAHIVACLDVYFEMSRLGMGLCDDVEPQEMAYLASLLGDFNLTDATVSIPDLETAIHAMNGLGYAFDHVLHAYYCRSDELDFGGAQLGLESIFDESNAGDPLVMQYADNFLSLCLKKSIVATVDEHQPVHDALIQMKTILQYAELAKDRGIILADDFEASFNTLVQAVLMRRDALTEREGDVDDELASVTAVSAMSRFGIMPIPRNLISPITVPGSDAAAGLAEDELEAHLQVAMHTPR
ncbi:MAG: hypothetical protein P1U40_04275 [Coxiellaceae bacterium]|nr:hypothetical protein [Coxiellaceae bacterium]